MAQEKEYTGTITLGSTTPTYDLESDPENFKDYSAITPRQLQEVTTQFMGEIMQVPPIHSAIKKDGKRVYELARRGEHVELEPRKITIKAFDITATYMPIVHFRVVCSTGTYIRSLANDVGVALGCGGHLSSLCRTRIGAFTIDQSMTVEEAQAMIKTALGQ